MAPRTDPLAGLNPEFASRLRAMQAAAAAEGVTIGWGSGLRSREQQAQLYRAWLAGTPGQARAAPPGRSNHEHGLAMDLTGDKAWANAHAAQFGLHFPVRGENWHVEMIDGEGAGGDAVRAAQRRGAAGAAWEEATANPEDELSNRLRMFTQMLIGEAPQDVSAQSGAEQVAGASGLRKDVTMIQGAQRSPQPGTSPQYNRAGGVEQWRGLVAQALEYVGEAPSEANIQMTLRRMQQESGGNPTIANNWDSNARRGTPSIGLMQVILPTFNAHAGELASRGQKDPFANLVASMRYAKSRYGSLAAAYNRKGGY